MLDYLLKSGACMAAFLLFYKLLLEKENMHIIKRFFLLGALITSLLIPTLVFEEFVQISPSMDSTFARPTNQGIVVSNAPPTTDMEVINWEAILLTLYFIGFILFAFRFSKHLFQIIRRIQKNQKRKHKSFTQVLLQQKMPPHTFFNYIFLNKQALEDNAIPSEVLIHEETHARQYHSLDVLFIELLQLVFWFNPLIFLYKRNIKLNHEFLADSAVLNKDFTAKTYQNTLLSYLSKESVYKYQSIKMANAITYSSIKKRFTVMKKQTSQKTIIAKSLLLLPLLALLLSGFCERKTIYTNPSQSSIDGLWLDQPMERLAFSIASDGKNLNFYQGYSEIPIVNINNRHFVQYPGTSFELVLDKEENVIQFRGKEYIRFENSFRKKYEGLWKSTDGTIELEIENYTDAFICNLTMNGSTNKFYPSGAGHKGFGFSYGHEYWSFELKNEELHDSNGNIYFKDKKQVQSAPNNQFTIKGLSKKQFQEYIDLVEKFENNKTGKNRVLLSETERMLKLQNNMSDKQKRSIEKVFTKVPQTEQTSASREQMKIYNALAKKYNAMPKDEMFIKMKEVELIKKIYGIMSDKQRADAEPFPDFPEPPDSRTFRSPPEVREIPKPAAPPTPPTPLDHVIEMAKKGASFYFEGKEISSDRAIELLKKNKNLNIETTRTNTNNPKVRITKDPIVINKQD